MTPSYDRAKAGRPARTYIQQLCEDTGCSPEDLPEAMNDREEWWERIRDIIILLLSFSHQCQLMVFHWSLSDSKSPQVSRTRLRILAVLSSAVVWIVSTRPPTSKSSRPFDNPLVICLTHQSQLAQSLLSCYKFYLIL